MIFIDSNIWNYYFDESSKEHKFVIKPLEKFLEKEKVVINTVIIMEVAHFLVKNLGAEIAEGKINTFLELPLVTIDLNYSLIRKSLELFYENSHLGIGGRDSTILATLKEVRTRRIFTHDEAFKRIKWLRVIDPVPKL